MDKYEVALKIEKFAPLELQEKWDCSGWGVDVQDKKDVSKIMLCLTVTDDVVNQARCEKCGMIISHHPLFVAHLDWKDINIYSAHTNMDRTFGGTTDTLIETLGLNQFVLKKFMDENEKPFLRYIDHDTSVFEFVERLRKVSPNLRYVNNKNLQRIKRIAFCAGSGTEFIKEAYENGADALVTGDLKFHTAVDSPILVFDIGHFESEILILKVFERLIGQGIKVVRAKESSPFLIN